MLTVQLAGLNQLKIVSMTGTSGEHWNYASFDLSFTISSAGEDADGGMSFW